jgi:hypothetical protein
MPKQANATHWIPVRFRCLTDDQVGVIQHRLLDQNEKAQVLADEYGVSLPTIYKAKAAVPSHLVHVNSIIFRRERAARFEMKKTPRRRAAR